MGLAIVNIVDMISILLLVRGGGNRSLTTTWRWGTSRCGAAQRPHIFADPMPYGVSVSGCPSGLS